MKGFLIQSIIATVIGTVIAILIVDKFKVLVNK